MLDLLTSILTGGATGLLGTALSFATSYFQARQRHAQELELRRLDMELAKVEAAGAERVAALELESGTARAELAAFRESYREAARRWSRPGDGWLMQFVDFVRGMTRPALTWGFVVLTGAIYFTMGDADAVVDGTAVKARIVDTVLYLTTTCVLWWFGARQIAKGARPAGTG